MLSPREVQSTTNHTNGGRAAAALRVSSDLALPHQAVTEAIAILGRRGSGKTNFGVVLVEELVAAELPVVVLDPVGVWWGLRAGADGDKKKGLPVYIFGGEHADVPLEPTAGAVIADFVVEARRPAVLDLSDMRKGEQIRFVTDFAERLYHAKARVREALHVMIDEADAFAPQRATPEVARCLGAIEDLIRRGRSRGLGMSMITQRPAVLNKNVITQAEALVVFQLTGPQDRKALDDWISQNDDRGLRESFESALPSLPRGEAFVWSPGWLRIFARAKIRKRRTFDSSATPEPGKRAAAAPSELAPVDLEGLKDRIAATLERTKATDPKALAARVAELEAELARAKSSPAPAAPPKEVRVEVPVFPRAAGEALARAKQRLAVLAEDLDELAAAAGDVRPIEFVGVPRAALATAFSLEEARASIAIDEGPIRTMSLPAGDAAKAAKREPAGDVERPRGERAILIALAQLGPLAKKRLAIVTGYKHNGGGFAAPHAALRERGAITGSAAAFAITDAGRAELGAYDPLPTGSALVDYWRAHAGGAPERRLLDELVAVHPRALSKAALAQRTGYAPRGGAYAKPLARLRAFGLIRGSGELRLGEDLARAVEGR
jgi:hypothetical protein